MNHIHSFTPHPTLLILYCTSCGVNAPIATAALENQEAPAAPKPRPRRSRATPQVDEVAQTEADLARRVMELPLDEQVDEALAKMLEQAQLRETERVPVVEDENLGAGAGI